MVFQAVIIRVAGREDFAAETPLFPTSAIYPVSSVDYTML